MASSRGTHSLSPGTKSTGNKFVNDGSFLEMFKKQMEKKGAVSEPSTSKTDTSTDQETKPSASSSTTKPTQATADKQPVLPLVRMERNHQQNTHYLTLLHRVRCLRIKLLLYM